ncbi:hypothetical protein SP15_168 [Bacillus phage SP-15]|uniref:Uncharacterized protein n=1 Tax=Bacillus phage SP-15 TaxID=1792032 RepID=A0A127AW93_9CAUD|nr:hypothetical protein SP15_168 [Bacillus phage SP-15]AMM44966.1 hypothetical protein SP15_168 [Bacillus phage SP-15]
MPRYDYKYVEEEMKYYDGPVILKLEGFKYETHRSERLPADFLNILCDNGWELVDVRYRLFRKELPEAEEIYDDEYSKESYDIRSYVPSAGFLLMEQSYVDKIKMFNSQIHDVEKDMANSSRTSYQLLETYRNELVKLRDQLEHKLETRYRNK